MDNEELIDISDRTYDSFIPKHVELIQLVKFWQIKAIDIDFSHFLTGCFCSGDFIHRSRALNRMGQIAELIGEVELRKALDEVEKTFCDRDPRTWDIFTKGDKAAYWARSEEFQFHFSDACHCTLEGPTETHNTTDWDWVEKETRLHREGKCSTGNSLFAPEGESR